MFEQPCGTLPECYIDDNNVGWSWQENGRGLLKTIYWQTMLECGSMTNRFLHTRKSAFNLIDPLVEAANQRFSVLLQGKLVDLCKSLPATASGQEFFWRWDNLYPNMKIYSTRFKMKWSTQTVTKWYWNLCRRNIRAFWSYRAVWRRWLMRCSPSCRGWGYCFRWKRKCEFWHWTSSISHKFTRWTTLM